MRGICRGPGASFRVRVDPRDSKAIDPTPMRGRAVLVPHAIVAALSIAVGAASTPLHGEDGVAFPTFSPEPIDATVAERVLALDPEHISAADVRYLLARTPAPRIINFQGSFAVVSIQSFAEYLIAMGYPESKLRNPEDGSLSQSSFGDSAELAGELAWYYEREGMMPMLVGHSQGGMMVVKILQDLAGMSTAKVWVWNPVTRRSEQRDRITDPWTGRQRPVTDLKVPYAAALATGRLPRLMLGQWSTLAKLRDIPDSVEEFSGFTIDWDPIAATVPGVDPYRATGSAQVRNISRFTRAWIESYSPGDTTPVPVVNIDVNNIVHSADIWFSVKKHWCIEAQRYIRAAQRTKDAH
ncbi:MAG: hypothetical protein E6H67_01570 [Betaproteobacteria bacterium]|nr:MAG: hypothetical protein E6H67_01570 [Betaproteobacteria bacterium]